MKTWVKLYTEVNHDPAIGTLTWAQRGIWTALLALAGEIDDRDEYQAETGALDTLPNIAWRLRCDVGELRDAITAFAERNMVDERDGVFYITHYGKRQRRPPSAKPEAVKERVQRHRAQQEALEAGRRAHDGWHAAPQKPLLDLDVAPVLGWWGEEGVGRWRVGRVGCVHGRFRLLWRAGSRARGTMIPDAIS